MAEGGEQIRAERVFAEFLADRDQDPSVTLDSFVTRHPDLADILPQMLRSHDRLRQLATALPPLVWRGLFRKARREAHRLGHRRVRRAELLHTPLVRLAAILVLGLGIVLGLRAVRDPASDEVPSEQVARRSIRVDQRLLVEFFEDSARSLSMSRARSESFPMSMARLADELLKAPGALDPAARTGVEEAKAVIEQRVAGARERAREELSELEDDPQKGRRLVAAKLSGFLATKLNVHPDEISLETEIPAIRALDNLRRDHAIIRLHVIDLDTPNGGSVFVGGEIFVQRGSLRGEGLGPARFVDETAEHAYPLSLPVGDWRITIQDPATRRHGVIRVFTNPGQVIQRVVFLRSRDRVVDDMVPVEGGRFLFGRGSGLTSLPTRPITSRPYWIDPFETTNEEYAGFFRDVRQHGLAWFGESVSLRPPMDFDQDGGFPAELRDHPVIGITWEDAGLYANWAGKRLPTEQEWERVARGLEREDRRYPWGDDDSSPETRVDETRLIPRVRGLNFIPEDRRTSPVHHFEMGAVPLPGGRVYRMGDNVSEWTEDIYARLEPSGVYRTTIGSESYFRVSKGGNSHKMVPGLELSQSTTRASANPRFPFPWIGIRCVRAPYPDFQR